MAATDDVVKAPVPKSAASVPVKENTKKGSAGGFFNSIAGFFGGSKKEA